MNVPHQLLLIALTILLSSCHIFTGKDQQQSAPSQSTSSSSHQSEQTQSTSQYQLASPRSDSKYSNVWDRVSAGYGLPAVNDSKINSYLRWHSNNQSYINRFSVQAEPYLYYVVSEMEANGIPLEMALIPIIESSYNPHVVSPSNTAGIWQFIPQTGKNFGLKQNSGYNGRKDVVASTAAAIRYLKKLSADFNQDWLLVIAAYNAGEGTVARAIEKNKRAGKATDFWSLPLPKHTQTYIPRLIALSKVIANPQRYNVSLKEIPNTPYFVKVSLDKPINLSQAARAANLDPNALKKLNSGMNGWLTSPTGEYPVLVPVADAEEFTRQLDNLPRIAAATHSETNESTTANSGGGKPTKHATHTVKSGESLWTIAKSQNTSVSKLAKLNNLSAKSVLKPGQKLRVIQTTH